MTDLRDQLADFDAAARRLLTGYRPTPTKRRATCHPGRPVEARGLCRNCYGQAWSNGTLAAHPSKHRSRRRLEEFVDMWELLRPEGMTLTAIANRLGMTRGAASQAHLRAVRRGLIKPDGGTA